MYEQMKIRNKAPHNNILDKMQTPNISSYALSACSKTPFFFFKKKEKVLTFNFINYLFKILLGEFLRHECVC